MYLLLTLFFTSLLGIAFMIGRKLLLLQDGQIIQIERSIFEDPYLLEKLQHVTIKNTKKHSFALLVSVIRLYFRTSNLTKNTYKTIKVKIENIKGGKPKDSQKKKEVSKFLKMIGDYKYKIRELKEKIKEEEEKSL